MEEITISTEKANLPAAIHYPGKEDFRTALIIAHGFRGSMDGGGRAVKLAERAAALGMTVIRFAFSPLENLSTQVQEIGTIVAYCRKNLCSKIVMLGRSMGGSSSLVFAAQDNNIAGLCLWATPCNLHETFKLSLGEGYYRLKIGKKVEINDEYGHLLVMPDFVKDFDKYDLLACIKKIKSPVLVIHGDQDKVVPLQQAETMWSNANEPKQLKIVQNGDHQLSQHANIAADAVLGWLNTNFK